MKGLVKFRAVLLATGKYSCFLLAGIFGMLTIWEHYGRDQAERKAQMPIPLSVPASDLMRSSRIYRGSEKAPYTLIEFGDYQCPPCRATEPVLERILSENSQRVRFTFRNLPLSTIHPFAQSAALTAEAGRRSNHFWDVHDALFRSQLSSSEIRRIQVKWGVTEFQSDQDVVRSDTELAARLGVQGTPTFLLCTPQGHVIKLVSIANLSGLLQ